MTGFDYLMRLLLIAVFAGIGLLLTVAVSALMLLSTGMSFEDLMTLSQSGMEGLSTANMRVLLAAQHLCVFIIPGLFFGFVCYRSGIWKGLDLSKWPSFMLAFFGIVFLMASYPLVNLSFLLNESIPLPSWASDFENQAAETLKAILVMDTPGIFIINLLLIAILPGIGEELLFRGIIQKNISGLLRNPIAAIWISAFIFSAIHMQFEGFLPRVVLGATLGYLYHWSKNLWVPIIAHAFNNGIQVILVYSMGMDVTEFEEQGSDQLKWWMIVFSVGIMYLAYTAIIKRKYSNLE
ncbi:MAG: type II CAAX endopeptidase family protein [Saprospiraceae bacterium]